MSVEVLKGTAKSQGLVVHSLAHPLSLISFLR